jgi:hypothetical protein
LNSNIYIPPSPHLKNAVQAIWQSGGLTPFHNEHIIPKGIVEVIFNFTEGLPMLALVGDRQYQLSNCFINGFNRAPIQIYDLPEIPLLSKRSLFRLPIFSERFSESTSISGMHQNLYLIHQDPNIPHRNLIHHAFSGDSYLTAGTEI